VVPGGRAGGDAACSAAPTMIIDSMTLSPK
jgi:hypothetical protein